MTVALLRNAKLEESKSRREMEEWTGTQETSCSSSHASLGREALQARYGVEVERGADSARSSDEGDGDDDDDDGMAVCVWVWACEWVRARCR